MAFSGQVNTTLGVMCLRPPPLQPALHAAHLQLCYTLHITVQQTSESLTTSGVSQQSVDQVMQSMLTLCMSGWRGSTHLTGMTDSQQL